MAQQDKYGIRDLKIEFPTDEACLEAMFDGLHRLAIFYTLMLTSIKRCVIIIPVCPWAKALPQLMNSYAGNGYMTKKLR